MLGFFCGPLDLAFRSKDECSTPFGPQNGLVYRWLPSVGFLS